MFGTHGGSFARYSSDLSGHAVRDRVVDSAIDSRGQAAADGRNEG